MLMCAILLSSALESLRGIRSGSAREKHAGGGGVTQMIIEQGSERGKVGTMAAE